ncbi:Tm-1-like ATP-binding domain-containing protein [Clostridium magnum]|uniref:Uncharacterized protein n=1 Tax=Clostridium magnum DSM 2767 TaxID=1121326 RepID=A0A161WQP6_9CLOT|nr:Tm-1-like ATP-binding domain-containing protein [Clostridium magnum]KZL88988.1 hypothetical protein CLMAG_56860 [Clostridium magnum DSM 2767]SHI23457.1 Uncharacterized protein, UPF0261 family [Clostridium magnum DSM 2767]
MSSKPKVIVAGMCDTKFTELKFLASEVEKAGGEVTIINVGCGHPIDFADVSLQDVLDTIGMKQDEIFKMDRSTAVQTVGEAGAKKVMHMYEEGKVDGIISWAGSMGTTTVTYLMRALPFGVPKVMLTDMASSDVSKWLGNKDIYIVNPTAEQGVNIVTRKMIANGAAAVVAMAKVGDAKTKDSKPLMAITAYGTTTQTVNKCSAYFNEKGWDTIVIHQVGTGATMEDLIRNGDITAIIDLTTGELTNEMYESLYAIPSTWNGVRLTAASEMGIPQIVTPGGCDQAACGPINTIPQRFLDDFKTGKRRPWKDTGLPFMHNAGVSIMYPTLEEIEDLSHYYTEKLNATKGPTVFVLPMQGWSAYDQSAEVATNERGWAAGNGDAPQWLPDEKEPRWSKRSTLMRSILEKEFDKNNENLDFIIADMNIVEPAFGDLCNKIMSDMIDGKWKKGMYRDIENVIG